MRFNDILVSRKDIGHGEIIERVINGGGEPYTLIIKDRTEVASCPTRNEGKMISWWKSGGWKMWKDVSA